MILLHSTRDPLRIPSGSAAFFPSFQLSAQTSREFRVCISRSRRLALLAHAGQEDRELKDAPLRPEAPKLDVQISSACAKFEQLRGYLHPVRA
jgi:hypothetical protein